MAGKGVGADQKFLPFKKALLIARSLKLKSSREWRVWCKSEARDTNVPSRPDRTYKHEGWQHYGHWLGTGNLVGGKRAFLPFKKALVYARTLKLKNFTEWQDWAKTGARPANMPSRPENVYTDEGWQGYGHWLGTGNVRAGYGQQFLTFKKALAYARSLKLKGFNEWQDWAKAVVRPANMPSNPHNTYRHDGWQGYGHWLGTGTVAPQNQHFLTFKKALVYAGTLKLKGCKEWEAWCKSGARPNNVPSNPQRTYKHDGWQGYGHWLGTGNVRGGNGQQFLTFKKALVYAGTLKLKGCKEWEAWCKSGARPNNVPSKPQRTYKHDGWQGYGHWLGTGNVRGGNGQQ